MTNLPVPTLASEVPGNFLTSALWNAAVVNGLTFALNAPMFYGYQAVAQSIPNNAATAITLDSESIDSYGGHSTSSNTSRYVAQVPGWYLCAATTVFGANTTAGRGATVYKNGVEVPGAAGFSSGATPYSSATGMCFVYLNGSGDYVEMWGYQNCGAALATNTTHNSSFMVLWVHV